MLRPALVLAVLALAALALACAQEVEQPAPAPNFTVVEVPTDPGLLLTIMHDLARDMGSLAAALWRDDLAAVAVAARAIADHPHVSPPEAQRIQGVLGDRFPDFAAGDHHVHESAVRLAEQAAAGDMDATLLELGELQVGCVACHQAFRDELKSP